MVREWWGEVLSRGGQETFPRGYHFCGDLNEVKDGSRSCVCRSGREPLAENSRGKGPGAGGRACWGNRKKSSWLEYNELRAGAVR